MKLYYCFVFIVCYSGMSNVHYKLNSMGLKISNEQAQFLLAHVKELGRLITDKEIKKYLKNRNYM